VLLYILCAKMPDTSRPKRSSSIYDNGIENNIATTEEPSSTPTTSLAAAENLKYGALDSYYQAEANHAKEEKKEANNASNRNTSSAKGFSKISALSSRSKPNCEGILPEKYRNDEDEEEEEEDGGSEMLFAPFDCLLSYIMPNNMDKADMMLKDEAQEGGRGAKGEGAAERSLSSSSSSSSRYCMGLWTTAYVFLMSLVIVAILSEFVMVITSRLSVTLGISKEVSGILFLAMGAQVPDTIESYSMAKAGKELSYILACSTLMNFLHTHTHTRTRTHIHAHTYTHTYSRAFFLIISWRIFRI